MLCVVLMCITSCDKSDEPKYSIVGNWFCSKYNVKYTFPKDGIIDYKSFEDGWIKRKYRITDKGDSLQTINISSFIRTSNDGFRYESRFITVRQYKINFYTNDSIMIEKFYECNDYEWCDITLVRIKE